MEKQGLGRQQSPIINQGRAIMKVYAARDYKDITHRTDRKVQVNIPEYMPTIPQDDKSTNLTIESGYFLNENYPITAGILESSHALELPLLEGSRAPVRFNKGAEFILFFPTGKVEEGFLIFIADKEKDKEGATNGG